MTDKTLKALSQEQYDAFWRDGFVSVEEAVPSDLLQAMRDELDAWIEESRQHERAWGETFDGRERFDVAPSHSADAPALRRVDNPPSISATFAETAFNSRMVDMVADLIGPSVKFHHSKINSKLPGNETRVEYHQDFPYTPHTNDDVVTALLCLDDMTLENGPLKVVAGSHKEGAHSLYRGDVFTGKVDDAVDRDADARATTVTGKAGSVCFMHTNVIHGSVENTGSTRRALFISVFTAADAMPLAKSPVPNENEGRLLRGEKSRVARLTLQQVELPPDYKAASFFSIQEQHN